MKIINNFFNIKIVNKNLFFDITLKIKVKWLFFRDKYTKLI